MHCKDVSMRDVDVDLTPENIERLMADWRAYVRTEILVLRHGDQYAAVELHKRDEKGLFRDVVGYDLLSLPTETVFHEDPHLDVLNTPQLARVQSMYPGKAVVVRGMFSHINFIKDIRPQRLMVIDSVPPSPSKLGVLTDIALSTGYVDHPIVKEDVIIDMADRIPEVQTEAILFPCRVSHMSADKPFYFLDDAPEINMEVTLIGCHLSKRIYDALYGGDIPFINVCPADYVQPGVKTIVKCCKVKQGHEIDGDVARVPWGATVPEVVDALNALFSEV